MTKRELVAAIKRAPIVYGGVVYTRDDVAYIKLVKSDLLDYLKDSDDADYRAHWKDGDLYVG